VATPVARYTAASNLRAVLAVIGDPPRLVIRARFPRLSETELAPFRNRTTSFVVDAMNGRGALDHAIKPLDPASRFVGSALTARAGARDNLAAIAALDLIEPAMSW
jgi:4-hydroxy-4-methyl-2-oxoglutarate aldolase